jgi:undecaprenyl pyrophosphate phosphatase UppP
MIIVPIVFIILGVLIKYRKMYGLIAGYNTMTQEEKKKYDIEGIATLMKNVMFGMASIMIIGLLISYWTNDSNYEMYALGLALVVGIPYLLIKSNSKQYKIDNH